MSAARDIRHWIQQNLFNAVPVSICVIDRDYRIIVANELFTRTYGSWENRCCYSVYKHREKPCVDCGALATFADGKVRTREEEGLTPDGRRMQYLVQLVPIADNGGGIRHVIEMSTDISELRRLEKEKTDAERLAAVGETVAGIAHGIKNVLMGLEGGMYVFNSGLEKGSEERMLKGWTMLEGNIKRISRFVREFLEFARGRPPEVSLVDPNEPARKVVELFRETASMAGIKLVENLEEGIAEAYLDEDGIHTCLANLISNAIQACTISDCDRPYKVTVSSWEKNGSIVYEVADNGCGMDYDISRKVFSSFFSTKSSEEGTGLGLLTTKKIAHQHGGKVSFETEEGFGSTFRIELPRRNLPKPAEKEEPETTTETEEGS